MKKTTKDLMCDTDYFSARRIGPVVVFQPKGNFLLNMTIIKAKEAVLEYFETMLAHPEIRVVLLLAAPRKARREEFLCFFDMVRSSRISKNSVMRLYRTIDQIMLHIIASDLFFIDANCGKILPMNANMALACDYRIIGDNAVFQNPALELGLISKGGDAWFLCRRLGRGRAFDYLLATHGITAQEAVAAGLADKCVPSEHFEVAGIQRSPWSGNTNRAETIPGPPKMILPTITMPASVCRLNGDFSKAGKPARRPMAPDGKLMR